MTCGIYRIEIGQYFYIGSSKNISLRIKNHLKKLKNKKHNNSFMLNVYEKHKDSFSFFILEQCLESELEDFERFWIEQYYDLEWNMNISKNCGWRSGSPMERRQHSEATKQKLREVNGVFEKKKSKDDLIKENNERVRKYLLFGKTRKDWWNVSLDYDSSTSVPPSEPSDNEN